MDPDELARLQALADYRVLDTPPEAVFDSITRLVAKLFNAPIVLVSLIDEKRQWSKSRVGLDVSEVPRELAFCDHAIRGETTLLVPDTTKDDRFVANPLVTGSESIRFYCGAPVRTPENHALGTLCVMDRVPRQLRPAEVELLERLARHVGVLLEVHRRIALLEEAISHQQSHRNSRELMMSMVVHDLRSPLSSIILLAALVTPGDEEARQGLNDILGEAERMQRMLTDVLDLCLQDLGSLRLRRHRFALQALVNEVARGASYLALSRGQVQKLELPESPVFVNADRDLLKRVFANLIGNAIHHGPPSERITISCRDVGEGRVRCEVRDRGATIPAADAESIFHAFERLTPPQSTMHRGYGLGLAFCRLAVEAHGGVIGVSPNPDCGNCFHFELPSSF